MGTSYSNKKKFEKLQKKIDSLCCELEICEENLATAEESLTICEGSLTDCEAALALCEASASDPITLVDTYFSTEPLFQGQTMLSPTVDANGESFFTMGQINLSDPIGTKTLSSNGGAIIFKTGNSSSNLTNAIQFGIKSIDPVTQLETGSFLCSGSIVSTPAADTWVKIPITSGSVNIQNGDFIAIGCESSGSGSAFMRGVADYSPSSGRSFLSGYYTSDTGSGPSVNAFTVASVFLIVFDDGSVGIVGEKKIAQVGATIDSQRLSISFNTNSSPNEYGAAFQLPFNAYIKSASVPVANGSTQPEDLANNIYISLYSDPYGSPTLIETYTVTRNMFALAGGAFGSSLGLKTAHFSPATLLNKDTWYAIGIRGDGIAVNTTYRGYYNIGFSEQRKQLDFGDNARLVSRTGSGSFSNYLTDLQVPSLWLNISQIVC